MKAAPVPDVPIDEEKLAKEIETDPLLNQYAMRREKLAARQVKTTVNHNLTLKNARQQYRLNMEAIYVELRVLRRRAALRRKYMRKVAMATVREDFKNAQDSKLAAEFKKELRDKLEQDDGEIE